MRGGSSAFLLICLLAVQTCLSKTIQCSDGTLQITQQTFDGEVARKPTYLGGSGKLVLIRTDNGAIWRSPNEGNTWEQIDFGNEKVSKIVVGTDKTSVLFVNSARNVTWVSRDAGRTVTRYEPGFVFMMTPKVHPITPDWVLTTGAPKNCFVTVGACSVNLYVSKDMGKTWQEKRKYVTYAFWGDAGLNTTSYKRIYAWEWEQKTGNYISKSQYDRVLSRSDNLFDAGVVKQVMAECAGAIYYKKGDVIYAAKWYRDESRNTRLGLYTSADGGDSFTRTKFSTELSESGYTILGYYKGSTFITVEHASRNWGNLYISDAADISFTESLRFNKKHGYDGRSPLPIDFMHVESLDGVYVANAYLQAPSFGRNQDFATYISYDMGGRWSRLRAPPGSTCADPTDCHLNLYGRSSPSTPFYSRKNAIGILLGQGSAGSSLVDSDVLDKKTYISRDAGWTWSQFYDDSVVYEIGNAGGLIVAAADTKETDSVLYTWDEGQSWTTCNFTRDGEFERVDFTNIKSEPSSLKFLMWGTRRATEADPSTGVLLHLDFTLQQPRACVLTSPGDPGSDYEKWSPSDTVSGNKCLMGQQIQYIRRKANRKCYNPSGYDPLAFTELSTCPCSEEDFECSYCYIEGADGTCVFNQDDDGCASYDPEAPPADCAGLWYKTRGYRVVPGNKCDRSKGIQDRLPLEQACPPSPDVIKPTAKPKVITHTHIGAAIFALFIIFLIVCLTGGMVWYISGKHSGLRTHLARFIPEKYLPAYTPPPADYSAIQQDEEADMLEEDAKPIDLERHSDTDDQKPPSSDDDEFDPRGDAEDAPKQDKLLDV